MRRAGFTLLEVIVALGIFAAGATAAFALLVAGASAGRRAECEVTASLVADSILADLRGNISFDLDLSDYPGVAGGDGDVPPPAGVNPEARWVARDQSLEAYPDYRYDLALTPLPGPQPDQPWEFLAEVEVRWFERGQGQSIRFATVLVRGFTHLENPAPPPPRR